MSADEFLEFFYLLTRRKDLFEIMKKFTKRSADQTMDRICMTAPELSSFLLHKYENVEAFINQYEMNKNLRAQKLLSLDGKYAMKQKSYLRKMSFV